MKKELVIPISSDHHRKERGRYVIDLALAKVRVVGGKELSLGFSGNDTPRGWRMAREDLRERGGILLEIGGAPKVFVPPPA